MNGKIEMALDPANTRQKTIMERRLEMEGGDNPRIRELNAQIAAISRKQVEKRAKVEKLRRKVNEIE